MTPSEKQEYWAGQAETAQRALEMAEEKLSLIQCVGQLALFISYKSSNKIDTQG